MLSQLLSCLPQALVISNTFSSVSYRNVLSVSSLRKSTLSPADNSQKLSDSFLKSRYSVFQAGGLNKVLSNLATLSLLQVLQKFQEGGTSRMVQWLRLHACYAGVMGLLPRSHIPCGMAWSPKIFSQGNKVSFSSLTGNMNMDSGIGSSWLGIGPPW